MRKLSVSIVLAGVAACGGGGGGGPDANNANIDGSVQGLRVFVSSLQYPANLLAAGGGEDAIESADNLCQGLADAVSLGGTYRAWLSTTYLDAIDHIQGNGPWYRVDGQLAFPNHAALGTTPLVRISIDEAGGSPDPYYEPWTGTAVGGRLAVSEAFDSTTCLDWTATPNSSTIHGMVGWFGDAASEPDAAGEAWTELDFAYCDLFERRLYCFEQP